MNSKIIGIIIVLVLLLALAGVIWLACRKISRTVRSYSRLIFGTDNVREGVQKMEMEYAATPKSVSSATGLYLPSIMRDFPEFHLEEMKSRAQNVLTSYLRGIDDGHLRHRRYLRLGQCGGRELSPQYSGYRHAGDLHSGAHGCGR